MALAVVFAYEDWCCINCIAPEKRTIKGLNEFFNIHWIKD